MSKKKALLQELGRQLEKTCKGLGVNVYIPIKALSEADISPDTAGKYDYYIKSKNNEYQFITALELDDIRRKSKYDENKIIIEIEGV